MLAFFLSILGTVKHYAGIIGQNPKKNEFLSCIMLHVSMSLSPHDTSKLSLQLQALSNSHSYI